MIRVALEGLAFEMTVVKRPDELSSGSEADLILCSAEGSWGDEGALLSQLNARGLRAPVVMLTAQQRSPEGYLGGQVISALKKPFHTQSLVRAVCKVLGRAVPHEDIFSTQPAVPLKRGGSASLLEPVEPATLIKASATEPSTVVPSTVVPSTVEPTTVEPSTPELLIPPPEQPPAPPAAPLSFQTMIGAPIPDELPSPPAAEAAESSYEPTTSFGFSPEGPQATIKGGSYQEWAASEEPSSSEPNPYEPSTSFGFSPSEQAAPLHAPPPSAYEEPPLAEPPLAAHERLATLDSTQQSHEPDELDELDDSFSALDHAELDSAPEWRSEVDDDAELSALPEALKFDRYAQSASPLLNSAVKGVLELMVNQLREAGIDQASHEESLELFSQVAWEVIPELAEQLVRREIEEALSAEEGR